MTSTMRFSSSMFFIVAVAFFQACLPGKKNPGIICTEEYRILMVTVTDSAGKPVLLTKYYLSEVATGKRIDFSKEDPYMDSTYRKLGQYILMTDGKMSMTSRSGTEFEFLGWKDDTRLVSEKYSIGNDACHVILLSGKQNIIVSE